MIEHPFHHNHLMHILEHYKNTHQMSAAGKRDRWINKINHYALKLKCYHEMYQYQLTDFADKFTAHLSLEAVGTLEMFVNWKFYEV